MGETEKKLRKLLADKADKSNLSSIEEFEESTRFFQELIDKGITKSRGYNLLTIESKEPVSEFNCIK